MVPYRGHLKGSTLGAADTSLPEIPSRANVTHTSARLQQFDSPTPQYAYFRLSKSSGPIVFVESMLVTSCRFLRAVGPAVRVKSEP